MHDPPLGAQDLVKKLRLKHRGRERGENNEPRPTQTGEDLVEREVIDECTLLLSEAKEAYEKHREVLEARIDARSDSPPDPPDPRVPLQSEFEKRRADLADAASEAQQATDEEWEFRRKHGRKRGPRVPENLWWRGGLLLVLVVFETALNGVFFGQNLAGGLLAGGSYAVLISAINVLVIGAVAAWALRELRHRDPRRRVGGGVTLLGFATLAVVLNLGIAHYREALPPDYPPEGASCWRGDDVSHGEEETLCLFRENLFELNGFQSYMLMLLGLAMCVLATWDWFRMTDPYPGYGALGKKKRKSEDELREREEDMRTALEDAYNKGVGALRGSEDPLDAWKRARAAIDELRRRHGDLEEYVRELAESCASAIQTYRNENHEARTEPVPEAWRSAWTASWDLPHLQIPNIGTHEEAAEESAAMRADRRAREEELRARLKELTTRVDRITRLRRP